MRRPEAWSQRSRTGPQQDLYPALVVVVVVVSLECSVASIVSLARTGVAVTSRRPVMLVETFSSQMTISSVKTTNSGKTKIVTNIIYLFMMTAWTSMGSDVRAPYRRVCIHGITIRMAPLFAAGGRSRVQTSQTR